MITPSADAGVAVAGSETWLRPELMKILAERGVHVVDKGRGAASLRGSETLVILPAVFPTRRSKRAADLGSVGVTLSAAVHDGIQRAVLLSRIGAGDQPSGCGYLDSLYRLETMVLARIPRTTVVRIAHPIGPPADPGPLVLGLRRLSNTKTASWAHTEVDALYSHDAAAALADAVTLDYGRGVLEVGGPARTTIGDLVRAVGSSASPARRVTRTLRSTCRDPQLRSLLLAPSIATQHQPRTGGIDIRDVWRHVKPQDRSSTAVSLGAGSEGQAAEVTSRALGR